MQLPALLEVEDLGTHFYSREGVLKAVDGVSFTLLPGSVLGIAGESGCGKSVTSQSILRIVPRNGRIVKGKVKLRLESGVVDLAQLDERGHTIRGIRGKEISMVFQEPMSSFSPVYTIGNQITEVIRLHQDVSRVEARRRAIEMLARCELPNPKQLIDAYPFELSGGMRQRAMIAMALACQPKLLIADEPTSALDVTVQAQILELLEELRREFGLAIILITHDLGVVAELCDHLMIMYLGKTVEYGPVRNLFHGPQHPYTRGLLASVPKVGQRVKADLAPITGSVPSLYELPTGCPFRTRCPDCIDGTCDVVEPAMVEVDPGHHVACHLYGSDEQARE